MPDQQTTQRPPVPRDPMGSSVVASAFGTELRRRRLDAGLPLRQFAQLVHYDAGHLSKIENGYKAPSAALAQSCDAQLGADGLLAHLATAGRGGGPGRFEPLTCSATIDVEEFVKMAADRAREFSLATQAMSGETVGLIYDEVRELAQAYPRRPLTELLARMVQVQDVAFRVLEDRARPADARQLYLLAGVACGMVAKASHDLAQPHAAMTQTGTAFICAEQAGHPGLQAWVRGLQAMIAYWAGRPAESVRHAAAGIGRCINTTSVWLPISEARGWAARGNAEQTVAAILRAEAAVEQVNHDDLDQLGGICTFTPARMQYYAADAMAWLPDQAVAAERYAQQACTAYTETETPEWAFGDQAGSQAALSIARAHRGEIDGAAEALAPVLQLAPEQRINGVIASVLRVGQTVRPPGLRSQTDELTEQIESFVRSPAAALPR